MNHSVNILPLGVTVSAPHGSSLADALKSCGIAMPCGGKGICGNCRVRLISGSIQKSERHENACRIKGIDADWRLACFSAVEDDIVIEVPFGPMNIQTDTCTADASPEENGAGVAIDLGSTTIVAQLIDLNTGNVIAERSGLNPQGIYGADIISRIAYAMEADENLAKMSNLIRGYLGDIITDLAKSCARNDIKRVTIVGNTVMHHLFAAYDVACLGKAPFNSHRNGPYEASAASLGWNLAEQCSVEFMPNISHFVGSDILAGIMACGMPEAEGYSLLVDLGTNGEMAIGNKHGIWVTSTAAGPAFEGINISCGMPAWAGAICSVSGSDSELSVKTIGGVKPRGICGSGLVEAIDFFLGGGLIDASGLPADNNADRIELAKDVYLTANDIHQFQLAKAAIATGIQILLESSGIAPHEISCVYLTGGLGNYVDVEKVDRLGLLPDISSRQCIKIGNAALAGCKRMLHPQWRRMAYDTLCNIKYCPLESHSRFMDLYCENLLFLNYYS